MNKFNQNIRIGKKLISAKSPAFIIGEIGSNHNLSLALAKKLIDVAAQAGVDAVKFQSLKFDQLYIEGDYSKDFMKLHKQIDLDEKLFAKLSAYAKKKGLIFLSSPTYLDSLEILEKLNMAAYKIASPITVGFTYLLAAAAKKKKPLIVSAGYCDLSEIDRAVDVILKNKNHKLILLHCVSSYPNKLEDINLVFMNFLADRYGCLVGYSDHSLSTSLPAVAVGLGARVIEKHFTLSRQAKGPDHHYSLEPEELAEMVKNIREAEKAMGVSRKLLACEKNIKKKVMMKLVAAQDLPAGIVLKMNHLVFRRVPGGIEESHWHEVIGKKVIRPISKMKVIKWRNINKRK